MLKRMGVIFRIEEYNDPDMNVCKRSGKMIETKISHGIVVIDTDSEFDARKFRKNDSVKKSYSADSDERKVCIVLHGRRKESDLNVMPAEARASKVCKKSSTKLNQQSQQHYRQLRKDVQML